MLRLTTTLVDAFRRSSPRIVPEFFREPNRCASPELEVAQFAVRRRQLIQTLFPGIPNAERLFGDKVPKYIPPGFDPWKMMDDASKMSLLEWKSMVQNKGPWDFKQIDPRYQEFGNWAYAVSATGNSRGLLQRRVYLTLAGVAQFQAGTYTLEWCWLGNCDDPADQRVINNAFDVLQEALRLRTPDSDTQSTIQTTSP